MGPLEPPTCNLLALTHDLQQVVITNILGYGSNLVVSDPSDRLIIKGFGNQDHLGPLR